MLLPVTRSGLRRRSIWSHVGLQGAESHNRLAWSCVTRFRYSLDALPILLSPARQAVRLARFVVLGCCSLWVSSGHLGCTCLVIAIKRFGKPDFTLRRVWHVNRLVGKRAQRVRSREYSLLVRLARRGLSSGVSGFTRFMGDTRWTAPLS